MSAFFDPGLIDRAGNGFIRERAIDDALRKLIPSAHISKGHYSYPSRSELRDLVWNHMDQNHRPLVHRTYSAASRIFIGEHASFSLTRFGRWPVVIPVFDCYFKDNGFYQVMVLFGLIAVVNIITCNSDGAVTRMDIDWAIASHRWLRFLHPLLNRRLAKLNEIQNREDGSIRDQRRALRAAGYRFKTDQPNFVNSNVVENNTIFPPVSVSGAVALGDLPDQRAVRVPFAERAFILRRDSHAVDVWPGVCLHEGANLDAECIVGTTLKCPWHGLEYGARRLVEGGSGIELCGARLDLAGGQVVMRAGTERLSGGR